jgi:PAS domain-containing protein
MTRRLHASWVKSSATTAACAHRPRHLIHQWVATIEGWRWRRRQGGLLGFIPFVKTLTLPRWPSHPSVQPAAANPRRTPAANKALAPPNGSAGSASTSTTGVGSGRPKVEKMHGYLPGTVTPTTEMVLAHKHPDDYRQIADTLDLIRQTRQPFSSRHRIIDVQGRIHHVVVVGDLLREADRTVIGTHGYYVDITPSDENTRTR